MEPVSPAERKEEERGREEGGKDGRKEGRKKERVRKKIDFTDIQVQRLIVSVSRYAASLFSYV